jgi:hypothetical protein
MEIILAIVVASAVIFFGALISMGNERQRKAIDGLREQLVLWAVQDLKIKREKMIRDVKVEDPLMWFTKLASKVTNTNHSLQVTNILDNPQALICDTGKSTLKFLFTPVCPSEIRKIRAKRNSQLWRYVDQNPLLSLPRATAHHEISVLNEGFMFDVELRLAWQFLTGQELTESTRLYIYEI